MVSAYAFKDGTRDAAGKKAGKTLSRGLALEGGTKKKALQWFDPTP